jgi:hypothetical protein
MGPPESLRRTFKCFAKRCTNYHTPQKEGDIIIVATPRGGSTWLTELIASQSHYKYISEPLNLRNDLVRHYLGFTNWSDLYRNGNESVILNYIEGLKNGSVTIMNHSPFTRHHRFITRRIVMKMIHGGENLLPHLLARGNIIIHLLRHPLAVCVSRESLPRLGAFIDSDYASHFSQKQIVTARHMIANGCHYEKGVVSWCFQNALPLRIQHPRLLRLTYEQMLLEPQVIIDHLVNRQHFSEPKKMCHNFNQPSSVINKSNQQTGAAIKKRNISFLLEKWRQKIIHARDEERMMAILETFDIDAYRYGRLVSESLWLPPCKQDDCM